MKIISLNIWGGHVEKPLLNFINHHQNIDIFCFQEVYHQAIEKISTEDRFVNLNIFSEIETLLPNHIGLFKPVVDDIYGIATFVKKDIDILGEGEIKIYDNPNYEGRGLAHSRNLQWVEGTFNNKIYSILNMHGLWNGQGKNDSPARIEQSQRIKKFLGTINNPKILCGDFNLRPDTDSIKILEKDMRNLICEHQIQSTRTNYYPKDEKFADYIFISQDINVCSFEVLNEEVSDHAPLLLDFN